MFGFRSAQEKALEAQNAHLEQANATLTREKAEAVRKNRELDGLAKQYRDRADIAGRQKAHLEAENHRLEGELAKYKRGLAMGTQASADRRRFAKECKQQVANRKAVTAAFAKADPIVVGTYPLPGSASDVSPVMHRTIS